FGSTSPNLVGFWVIERKVFWPFLFADPSQQPIRVLAPYDKIAAGKYPTVSYQVLTAPPLSQEVLAKAPYLLDWLNNFDFVVVISTGCSEHLDAFDALPLSLVEKTDVAALYKVKRPNDH